MFAAAVLLASGSARADEADDARREVTGVQRPASEPGDVARYVGSALLYVPRVFVDLAFLGTAVAAGVIANEQVVPRVQELVQTTTPGGRILVFPTAFVETGRPFNVGARMIATTRSAATSIRVGFGGIDDTVLESRFVYEIDAPLKGAINVELLHQRQDALDYIGVGQEPETDPRNQFRAGASSTEALYFERRTRAIVGVGYRLSDSMHLQLSTSVNRRKVRDSDGAEAQALSQVFEPGSVPGASEDAWVIYSETAARVDTRTLRGAPSSGVLLESYAGTARRFLRGPSVSFLRTGGRVAAFIPIYRSTNILSPAVFVDGVVPLGGLAVPFTELPQQPEYRGIDDRRDNISLVAALSYRWLLVDHVGARLFVDTATVADEMSNVDVTSLRFAGGFGLDLHTASAEIGRISMSGSPDGVRLLFSVGVSNAYGDRQHRD